MNEPTDPREAHSAMDLMDEGYRELGEALVKMREALRMARAEREHDDDD